MATEYPLAMVYCPNCSMPPEYCSFSGARFEKCKPWLRDNFPELYPELAAPRAAAPGAGAPPAADALPVSIAGLAITSSAAVDAAGAPAAPSEEKKPQKSGGGAKSGGKKKADAQAIIISVKDRGRRKFVTSISGLEAFDVKLKEAASALGKKFGSGATVSKTATGGQEIDIQGDLTAELPEMLTALFGVPEAAIIVRD